MMTVYLVTNRVVGHTYIGVTRFDLEKRWANHVWTAQTRAKSYLHRAIVKYGKDAFTIEALASCLTSAHAGDVERALIQQWRPVYNQTNGGEVTRGRRGGPELYARIAAKNRGLTRTPEQIAANSATKKALHRDNPTFHAVTVAALARGRKRVNQDKRIAAIRKTWREKRWTAEELQQQKEAAAKSQYRPPKRPVECLELKAVFDCAEEAAQGTGVTMSCVRHQCLYGTRRRKPTHGFTFEYV